MQKKTRRILTATVPLLVLLIICVLFLNGIIKINTPSLEEFPVRGVDVSEYQGRIDWQVMERQDIMFAFIKATEGSSYSDPFFSANWAGVRSTSILHGAYHFFSFDSPAQTQAENFISTVGQWPGMLPPVVDIELYGKHKTTHPEPKNVREDLRIILDALEEFYGVKPIIYATQQSYKLYIDGHFPDCPLWIRDVYFTPNPALDGKWDFWQYSDKGKLAGYEGTERYIDLNVFNGPVEKLEAMAP